MGFTAVVGLAAGTTAVTTVTVLAAVAEIGLALSVVGAVTGSKDLMKIGGMMSLVGGVGGMVANAGAAAGGAAGSAAAAESAITGEAAFGGYAAEAGSAAAAEAGISAGAAAGESAGASGFGADLGGQSMRSTMPDLSTSLDMAGNAAPGNASSTMSLTPDAASTGLQAPAPAAIQAPSSPADINYDPFDFQGPTNPLTGLSSNGAAQTSSSFFKTFTDFAEKNKEWIKGGLSGMQKSSELQQKNANDNRYMDIQQQTVNQKGYGNTYAAAPRGILSGAR